MRIHGRIKMGHYPTPAKSGGTNQELSCFSVQRNSAALDPCCGEGDALAGLVAGTSAITYGVELDHQRAEESKTPPASCVALRHRRDSDTAPFLLVASSQPAIR